LIADSVKSVVFTYIHSIRWITISHFKCEMHKDPHAILIYSIRGEVHQLTTPKNREKLMHCGFSPIFSTFFMSIWWGEWIGRGFCVVLSTFEANLGWHSSECLNIIPSDSDSNSNRHAVSWCPSLERMDVHGLSDFRVLAEQSVSLVNNITSLKWVVCQVR